MLNKGLTKTNSVIGSFSNMDSIFLPVVKIK